MKTKTVQRYRNLPDSSELGTRRVKRPLGFRLIVWVGVVWLEKLLATTIQDGCVVTSPRTLSPSHRVSCPIPPPLHHPKPRSNLAPLYPSPPNRPTPLISFMSLVTPSSGQASQDTNLVLSRPENGQRLSSRDLEAIRTNGVVLVTQRNCVATEQRHQCPSRPVHMKPGAGYPFYRSFTVTAAAATSHEQRVVWRPEVLIQQAWRERESGAEQH
ncbi:hypothetical protein ElyMa_003251200 [Elysia marginata]|uniref:Uncharacterized protein n=1 Tax=Elysia marginata TaxID=1093978 RepID=A0AAV4J6M8_9GAST|nr:hypothetical protein ElyMa_003251200 [Elysia marginata]